MVEHSAQTTKAPASTWRIGAFVLSLASDEQLSDKPRSCSSRPSVRGRCQHALEGRDESLDGLDIWRRLSGFGDNQRRGLPRRIDLVRVDALRLLNQRESPTNGVREILVTGGNRDLLGYRASVHRHVHVATVHDDHVPATGSWNARHRRARRVLHLDVLKLLRSPVIDVDSGHVRRSAPASRIVPLQPIPLVNGRIHLEKDHLRLNHRFSFEGLPFRFLRTGCDEDPLRPESPTVRSQETTHALPPFNVRNRRMVTV